MLGTFYVVHIGADPYSHSMRYLMVQLRVLMLHKYNSLVRSAQIQQGEVLQIVIERC